MVFPLTQQSSGLQGWKVVIPPERNRGASNTEGYEWLYVLSGQMRLILGEHDITMGRREVAEFDTRLPHWFGRRVTSRSRVLSVHGSGGERMHCPRGAAAQERGVTSGVARGRRIVHDEDGASRLVRDSLADAPERAGPV